MTEVVRTIRDLRIRVDEWHSAGQTVALVPTMGYLHNAHIALIDAGRQFCSKIVVSIFVNPNQFGPKEDFVKYPRDEAHDLSMLKEHGVDAAFAPSVGEMYPPGFSTTIAVPSLTTVLCATNRPEHFGGVAIVCTKLFIQCRPDAAIFGEKDYQQLQIIRRLVKDLDIPIDIHGVPTVREPDGLAISSRNVYLTDDGRAKAASISVILANAARRIEAGSDPIKELTKARLQLTEKVGSSPEYLELCDAETLVAVIHTNAPARLLTAINIDGTRLIDNWPIIPRNPAIDF